MFYKRKILILKEEGDTLHFNQAYDQSVAKYIEARNASKPGLASFSLENAPISVVPRRCFEATWIESFTKVNHHP